ncbi:MAG: GNAT family N-acetyltransferase [Dechloromonas sp.]|nr:GNAT family N-acetyltransferase [Dechloromonas sp.]
MTPSTLRATLVTDQQALAALQADWEGLLAKTPRRSIFLEWEWATHWLTNFNLHPWIVTIRDAQGQLCGLAPWVRDRRGPLWQIRFIGSGLTQADHLDIIAHDTEQAAISACLADFLSSTQAAWDILVLDGLDGDSALPDALHRRFGPGLQRASTPCPYIPFAGINDWAHFQKTRLSSHMRSKGLRYLQNVLNRENPGQVFYERITEASQLGAALECLIEQHQQRWSDKQTYTPFEDAQFLAFHRAFAQRALDRGWLGLYRLRVGEQTIATVYGFHHGNKFFDYQHALNNDWSKFSPGRQLIAYIVEHCITGGESEYDFLCGTEKYKYSWTTSERHDQNPVWARGWRGKLWLQALTLRDALKRWRASRQTSADA